RRGRSPERRDWPMKILLAEDEPRIASDIAAVLKASGMAVDTVRDGEAAWFAGDVESYDAAILDLGLPKLDGLTVLKRWRASARRFPVLILTARGLWTERVEGINVGADDYLPKPFEMEELLARLLAILMHHAGRVVAPTELAEHLYDSGNDRDPNAIEVIVARLRRKLGNDVI